MQRRLSKEESRQRYDEGRKLWNEFDPIGVADAVDDEYDSYIGPCLRIVEAGEGVPELVTYVRWVVFERIGLSELRLAKRRSKSSPVNFVNGIVPVGPIRWFN